MGIKYTEPLSVHITETFITALGMADSFGFVLVTLLVAAALRCVVLCCAVLVMT
jgi:hypothetical protein